MVQVEYLLSQTIKDIGEPLRSMLGQILGTGKRLRPALVILIGRMFNAPAVRLHTLAAAIEIVHSATLIHDDVVDEAQLRRGRKTLHAVWPIKTTVLAGDYLLAWSVALIAELNNPRILKVLAESVSTICAGEIQYQFVTKKHANHRKAYFKSIEAKTASLFAATAEMAGILANAEESHITALRAFGHALGTAFQIVDDVLDFTGEEMQLGKPPGSDLRQGLITLPTIYYLEKVKNDNLINTILAGQRDEERVRKAIEAIRSSGAIEDAIAEAHRYVQQSQAALQHLPESESRHILYKLADYVVQRKR
jgi:geranylgeranyl pyrophosphate synthase